MANEYDLVVIGAGTGGYPTAIRAAQLGLRVAVVEKQKALGGTCLIWGCIPTKALLEHAHALKVARAAKEWGLTIDGPSVGLDMKQVQARKDKVVTTLTKGVEFLFRKNKIDWIKGSARLAGNGLVEVTGEQPQTLHSSKEIVVATGSQPRSVPCVEIDRKRIITSDEAIGLREVPKAIVILGAGAVGVEFASIFRSYGSQVTIIEILPRLVPVEDEAVSAELQKAFKKRGIGVHVGAKVTRAQASADAVDLEVQLADGKVEKLRADYLLVATGRGPVTEGLGAGSGRLGGGGGDYLPGGMREGQQRFAGSGAATREAMENSDVDVRLRGEYAEARKAKRTAAVYSEWLKGRVTQAAAAWVLAMVFVRYCEDNELIEHPLDAGVLDAWLTATPLIPAAM